MRLMTDTDRQWTAKEQQLVARYVEWTTHRLDTIHRVAS